jgi:type III secretion protein J
MRPRLKLLAILTLFALAGCKQELYSKLSEPEANQMLAVLMANRIEVEKYAENAQDGGFTLAVDKKDMLRAITALNNAGLPTRKHIPISKVFEKSGMISSPFEERVRYVNALGEELANTLTLLDGVVSARVHIVLPEPSQLGQTVKPSSAAVFIKHRPGMDLDFQTPQIRRLVASSIEDLKYSDVTVVLAEATESKAAAPIAPAPVSTVEVLPGIAMEADSQQRFWTIVIAVGAFNLLLLSYAVVSIFLLSKKRRRKPITGETAVSIVEPS